MSRRAWLGDHGACHSSGALDGAGANGRGHVANRKPKIRPPLAAVPWREPRIRLTVKETALSFTVRTMLHLIRKPATGAHVCAVSEVFRSGVWPRGCSRHA